MNEPHKWRRSDIISLFGAVGGIGGLALIGSWIWGAAARNVEVNEVVVAVKDKDTGLAALNTRMTVFGKQHEEEERLLYAIADAVGATTKKPRGR